MIIVSCANGRVAFRNLGVDTLRTQRWFCMNDGTVWPVVFKPRGQSVQQLEAMFAHAAVLRGAIQSVNDLAEVQ